MTRISKPLRITFVFWAAMLFLLFGACTGASTDETAGPPTAVPTEIVSLPPLTYTGTGGSTTNAGNAHTIIPDRALGEIITYEVQKGDSLFIIAEKYDLEPETILWGNEETLKSNPNLLKIGQTLNILPIDGVYHLYKTGESLVEIADQYNVDVMVIVDYPSNQLDPYSLDLENPNLVDGTWLIIPGGKGEIVDWGPPSPTRNNPASAAYYGEGHCGEVYTGAIGTWTFIWPTTSTYITQYYSSIHKAIDIGGEIGYPIFASDTGVIVYAGWSSYGYGNLVVIDHGTGWTTAYAHLDTLNVYCGQSVYQNSVIATMGNTGNSTGPHLHFEMTLNGVKVDPLQYVAP